jgi:hypothetical protein
LSGIFFEPFAMSKPIARLSSLAAVCIMAIAGCTPAPSKPPESTLNLAGFPPAFRDGYGDGCRSAQAGSTKRDAKRYEEDRQYAAGWRDGFDICKRKKS